MSKTKRIITMLMLAVTGLFIMPSVLAAPSQGIFLTLEEERYIFENPVLKAVSLGGSAPLQYIDANGQIQGISRRVLEEVSRLTGLAFELRLQHVINDSLIDNADIIFGISQNYAPECLTLSIPYLKSETILFMNSSIDSSNLEDKIYAHIMGSELPEGINEKNVHYYETREKSLDAVEKGQADYGYGNAYSVAFYTLQNGYRNIVTIPRGKEARAYCMGVVDNDILLSILNKSIAAIDETQMQSFILEVNSRVERNITPAMLVNAYGKEIVFAISLVILILLLSVISHVRINNRLRMQNKRHELLSQISNEYLYEYFAKPNRLELSEKCAYLFRSEEDMETAGKLLKQALLQSDFSEHIPMVKVPLDDGRTYVFKAINSNVYDNNGRLNSIIGKLIDISEETAERERLIIKSRTDGMTGLYNAITVKELIIERLKEREEGKTDAFVLIDCDNFKVINDTHGHLMGNQILERMGEIARATFRSTDILGRIGGDEFCFYIKDVPSEEFVRQKCRRLGERIKKISQSVPVAISMGVVLVDQDKSYEEVFRMADLALYQAKRNGGGQEVLYNEL
jgi:diguanylate cyclase (GGDEF)-like protein